MPALKPAEAVPNYDGLWSVVIVTEQGLCDRAYRAPIRISKGNLANASAGAFTITGKVAKNGLVTVMVSQGDKSATGTGRLSGKTGTGSWSGGPCAAPGRPSAAADQKFPHYGPKCNGLRCPGPARAFAFDPNGARFSPR